MRRPETIVNSGNVAMLTMFAGPGINQPRHPAVEIHHMSHPAQLTNAHHARAFILGGNATVTLVSTRTGTRFTYKIRGADTNTSDNQVHFVSLLAGPDNERDFNYLGRIADGVRFHPGRKYAKPGDVSPMAPSSRAFGWVWQWVTQGKDLPTSLEIWHEGRCGRCNRKLTVPSSLASGFGPECVKLECV